MSKLFHDDARIASLMGEWHGVEYSNCKIDFQTECFRSPSEGLIKGKRIDEPDRFIIHPDSDHLFEPQAGDVLQDRKGECFTYIGHEHLDLRYFKIIQRNNKPFFWPEEK